MKLSSIKRSLYVCAAILAFGGLAAPAVNADSTNASQKPATTAQQNYNRGKASDVYYENDNGQVNSGASDEDFNGNQVDGIGVKNGQYYTYPKGNQLTPAEKSQLNSQISNLDDFQPNFDDFSDDFDNTLSNFDNDFDDDFQVPDEQNNSSNQSNQNSTAQNQDSNSDQTDELPAPVSFDDFENNLNNELNGFDNSIQQIFNSFDDSINQLFND